MTTSDLRGLIERVAERDGPMRLELDEHAPDAEVWDIVWGECNGIRLHQVLDDDRGEERDVLAGVLRRDMTDRGWDLVHYAGESGHLVDVWNGDSTRLTARSKRVDEPYPSEPLTAFLRAWLAATDEP